MRRSLVALALALMLPMPALAGEVTVKPGESLSVIAERHGISLTRLMELNGIRDADLVQAGQVLRLPGGSSRSGSTGRGGTITVQPGETLSEIAERHGIELSQLMRLNGIRNADAVEAGQTLRVTAARPSPATAATSPAASTYPRGASSHVVRSGETLSTIASGYGISLSRLIALNAIEDPDHVETGVRLKLKGQPAAAPRPTPGAATRPAPRPGAGRTTTAAASAAAPSPARPSPRPPTGGATTPTATGSGGTGAASTTTAAATGSAPATAAAGTASGGATARPDWRTYGPLQINWAGWQSLGGSMVTPTLNAQGQSLYLAINCGARKLNATTSNGEWQTWGDPVTDYERQLLTDYCLSGS